MPAARATPMTNKSSEEVWWAPGLCIPRFPFKPKYTRPEAARRDRRTSLWHGTFPPRGRARVLLSVRPLGPKCLLGWGAVGVPPAPPPTTLQPRNCTHAPPRLDTQLADRGGEGTGEVKQPPSGSHLPQRQPHALPPATTVTHTVHTPRGIFRARAGDGVRLKMDWCAVGPGGE